MNTDAPNTMLLEKLREAAQFGYKHSPNFLQEITRSIVHRVNHILNAISAPPHVEGVRPEQQEHNWIKLMMLRLRHRLRDASLTFEEIKRMNLSDRLGFAANGRIFDKRTYKIDHGLEPLTLAINDKPYLYSVGSCSGHLHCDPEDTSKCFYNESGFIGFEGNSADSRFEVLVDSLQTMCQNETREDTDCVYKLELDWHRNHCKINWNWNHPEMNAIRPQLRGHHANDVELEKLCDRIEAISPLAREKDIPGKHMAFVRRLTELIESLE